MDILLRLAIVAAFLVLVTGVVAVVRWAYRRRLKGFAGEHAADLAERFGLPRGVPTVLYLSTPKCVECVELQEPALERLSAAHRVEVRKLWASEVPDVAARFSIITAPSTIVLDAEHRVRAVNAGFADTPELAEQIG